MKDIQTKKVKVINKETLIVTIDISKVTNVGYCRCPNGIDVKPFGFLNNGQGFESPILHTILVLFTKIAVA